MQIHGVEVKGLDVDEQTRCLHYAQHHDIIAIKFYCCSTYYPCHACHQALADHPIEVWPSDQFDQIAILCGSCGWEMAISTYWQSDSRCPHCHASFNPGCKKHGDLYFEMPAKL